MTSPKSDRPRNRPNRSGDIVWWRGSAQDALLALLREEFAVLILDVQMPGVTGFELLR